MPPALLAYFVLAAGVSFFCSLLEATVLSINEAYVELAVRERRPSGVILQKLKRRIDRPLIAILTLNTVANMAGAAGVGAEAGRWARAQGWDHDAAVGVAAAALTFTILVCSEIIPKTLGAVFWKPLAVPAAYLLSFLLKVLAPVVFVLEVLPKLISGNNSGSRVTRDEIRILAEIGRDRGAIAQHESRVIANLLGLDTIQVREILTPRGEVLALREHRTPKDVLDEHRRLRFSRIPIFADTIDNVTGVVRRDQILTAAYAGRDAPLRSFARPIHAVPETQSIAGLLRELDRRGEHIFLVVNEYGGTEGIVTREDALETLLGIEIVDETDTDADLQARARERFEQRRRRLAMLDDQQPDPLEQPRADTPEPGRSA